MRLACLYVDVADGGVGPDYGIYPLVDLVATYKQFRDDEWPERLVPLADMGCGDWWCLDCRSDDGPIVVMLEQREPPAFGNTGLTLRSWLRLWLDGAANAADLYEQGERIERYNPTRPIQRDSVAVSAAGGQPATLPIRAHSSARLTIASAARTSRSTSSALTRTKRRGAPYQRTTTTSGVT